MNKKLARRVARQNQYVFTITEVARRLGVSDMHVGNLIDGGDLEAINVAGRGPRKAWRIPREALERFQARFRNLKSENRPK